MRTLRTSPWPLEKVTRSRSFNTARSWRTTSNIPTVWRPPFAVAGTYLVMARARDQKGRTGEAILEVTVDPAAGQVATPIANPRSGPIPEAVVVEITTATAGATVEYQFKELTDDFTAPTTGWLTYTNTVVVDPNKVLWTRATKSGSPTSPRTSVIKSKLTQEKARNALTYWSK